VEVDGKAAGRTEIGTPFGTRHEGVAKLESTHPIDNHVEQGNHPIDARVDRSPDARLVQAKADKSRRCQHVLVLRRHGERGDVPQRAGAYGYPCASEHRDARLVPSRFDVVSRFEARSGLARQDQTHCACREPSAVVDHAEEDAGRLVGVVLLAQHLASVAKSLEENRPLDVASDIGSGIVCGEGIAAIRLGHADVDG